MKKLTLSILLLLGLTGIAWGAIPAGTVWEVRTTGAQANGGGFVWTSLVSATYAWTASGSGTNEYYCRTAALGNPSLTASGSVTVDGNYNLASSGSVGSLAAGTYAWADNDALGYTTLYVRLANGLDPDAMTARGRPGYVSYGVGGTDYSQQAAAQLALTDIASDVAGTTITSATGGFTAAMVNNIIYITGGDGFTAGWYQIVSRSDTNTIVIDRSAGASKSGGTCNVGGAFLIGDVLDNEFLSAVAGNQDIFTAAGTYNAGEAVTTATVADGSPIRWLGYNASRGDNPMGTDRPLVDMGGSGMIQGGGTQWYHLRFTGTSSNVVGTTGLTHWFINVSATNTGVGATLDAFDLGGAGNIFIGCEASSTGSGISCAFRLDQLGQVFGCYARDSAYGFYCNSTMTISGSIADACAYGIYDVGGFPMLFVNCTIYACTAGYEGTASSRSVLLNCAFDACTTDIVGNASNSTLYIYNTMDGTTNMTNAKNAFGNIFADPGLMDPANANFRIDATDTNVYEQGADVGYFTSAVTYEE